MSLVCYDQDWFDELTQIKISFLRQVHNQAPKNIKVQSQQDIDKLFLYPSIKENNNQLGEKLQNLYIKVEQDREKPAPVRDLWLEKLAELKVQANILDSIYKANFKEEAVDVQEFSARLNSIWKKINPDIFSMTLAEAKIRLSKRDLNFIESSKISFPSKAYSDYHKAYKRVRFEKNLALVNDPQKTITLVDFKAEIEKDLAALGLKNWNVRFDTREKFGRFVVLSKSKLILLPIQSNNHDFIKYKRAIKLLHHEVYTHVIRSESGLNSTLCLLGIGLAGYYEAEEGIATFREQKVVGTNKYFAGFLSYLAVGLASGLDRNNVTRMPIEFIKLFTDVYIQLGLPEELAHQKAIQKMFRVYIKLGNHYVVNNFELIYREGNIKIHKLVSSDTAAEENFDIGKFDPTSLAQVTALAQLGLVS